MIRMKVLTTLTVFSLVAVCKGQLKDILEKEISRLNGGGRPYNNWEVTNFQTYGGYQGTPVLTPENIVITEITMPSKYRPIPNQRYPVGNQFNQGNQFNHGNPNVVQGTWNAGVQNQKAPEETVVVVVYDDQPPKIPPPTQHRPPFVNYQGNNGNDVNTDAMVLNQITSFLNQQQQHVGNQGYNHQQYPNSGQQFPNNYNNYGNRQPLGQNIYNGNKPNYMKPYPDQVMYDKPTSEDTQSANGSQKPPVHKGPNYPNNVDNRFISSTSEKNVKSTQDDSPEESDIDIRTSFDDEPNSNDS